MKHTNHILILIVLFLCCTLLVGCSGRSSTITTDVPVLTTDSPDPTPDIQSLIEKDPYADNALDFYRLNVRSRLQQEKYFSDAEIKFLKENGYETSGKVAILYDRSFHNVYKYYYPIVTRHRSVVTLWYTTEGGSLLFKNIIGHTGHGNYGGQVHIPEPYDGQIIKTLPELAQLYNPNTGCIYLYQFGELSGAIEVLKGATYCGFSLLEGYIFRLGTDVYSLYGGSDFRCIAHGVEYVIDVKYEHSSDCWAQPLFLMTDGSLAVYVGWSDLGESPDDPGHLLPLQYEGGYSYR